MAEQNFLPHFIEEPIYLIKEEQMVGEQATQSPETPSESSTKVEEPTPVYVKPLPTEGDNLKHCIVLVNSDKEVLEEHLKDFLLKIMGAVKRQSEDILIANCKNATEEQIEALLANHNHRHLLDFNSQSFGLLANSTPYEIKQEKGVFMIKVDSLDQIEQNVDMKKALWKALQEMFL